LTFYKKYAIIIGDKMEKEILIREDSEGQLYFDFFEDVDLVDSKH
jgi:hypothetical protein